MPASLALAALYGLLTALAFALWPLGRAHDVPVSALFRDQVDADAPLAAPAYLVAALRSSRGARRRSRSLRLRPAHRRDLRRRRGRDLRALRARRALVMWRRRPAAAVRGSPRCAWRIANIHRPGALTPSLVLSLGLGLTLLVTLALIDGNLRRQLAQALPEKAPSFFFLDIPNGEATAFDAFLQAGRARAQARARADAARPHRVG